MAKVLGTFYTAETQRRGVTPVSPPNAVDDPQDPVNPPGSGPVTYKTLGDTTDKDFIGKNGMVPVVVGENVLTLQPLPGFTQDGLITPGIVQWTGTGYVFNVSGAFYRIGGVAYSTDPTQKTLAAPNPTNNRIDVFAVDTNGIVVVIQGTASASPVKPQINPSTQLELTSVLVIAASTTPTLTTNVIYDQNVEWTGSSSGTGTANFASTVDPFQGSVSVETTNIQNGFQIQFNNRTPINIANFQTLGFQIKLKSAMPANQNIYITFLDGSLAPVSNFVLVNLDKSLTTYQFIGIALNAVNFTSFDVQYIRFSFVRTSGPATFGGYFLDILKLEGGINPPKTVGSFLNLTDTPSSYVGQASKVVSVKADETGLEFSTPSGGGITGSGTTNEIAYFTGATAIGSLTTATYPSLTELSYVKGVTSSIQTQLNGKQDTLVSGTNIKTINGSSILGSGNLTVSASITGTDTYVTFFDGANNPAGDSGMTYIKASKRLILSDASTELTADFIIDKASAANGVAGINIKNRTTSGEASFALFNDTGYLGVELFGSAFANPDIINNALFTLSNGMASLGFATLGSAPIDFRTAGPSLVNNRMRILGNGNILINTLTDAGYKLHVNGTFYSSGLAVFGSNLQISQSTFSDHTSGGNSLKIGSSTTGASFAVQNVNEAGFSGIEYINNGGAVTVFTGYNNGSVGEFRFNNIATNALFNFMIGSATKMQLANSGNILIGTTTDIASALLNLTSTSKGFLPPRMTGAQAEAISSPSDGLFVYINSGNGSTITTTGWWGRDASTWVKLN